MTLTIRPAQPGEAASLTALMWRSKAHWGYSEAFMALARPQMVLSEADIAVQTVCVGEADGLVIGFYQLRMHEDGLWLEDLFIEPAHIGRGYGKALFVHAVAAARARGADALHFESDPHAEGFYRALGCEKISERLSLFDRLIPRMRYTIPPG